MHRMRDTDFGRDKVEKMAALRSYGRVLDVCTGLGYTGGANGYNGRGELGGKVERDEGVVAMEGRNPWWKGLFEMEKVTRVDMDAVQFVRGV